MKSLAQVLIISAGALFSHSALATNDSRTASSYDGMISLSDAELEQTQGQALFNLSYLAPGQSGNPYSAGSNIGFYTFGMEAEVSINANIKRLQVGCGGVNGSGACDLDIQNFSLGCIADVNDNCITLPKTDSRQPDGVVQETVAGDKAQSKMKNFTITNPFYQFAIRNPNSASTREIIGMRIGGAQVSGPMSFGSLTSFSGYLTGLANLTLTGAPASTHPGGVTPTCQAPDNCTTAGGRARYQTGYALGLPNDDIPVLGGIATTQYKDVTVNYTSQSRTGLGVVVNGNRVTQAQIAGLELGELVDDIVESMSLNQAYACTLIVVCLDVGGLSQGIKDAILGGLKPGVKDYVWQQLASGLGKTDSSDNRTWLNNYNLPFNLTNVHQLEVSSNLFGIAVSKEALQYPGYAAAVNRGWSMYIPNGFELDIIEPMATSYGTLAGNPVVTKSGIVRSITSPPYDARNGNAAFLQAPYRNCWGSLTFC